MGEQTWKCVCHNNDIPTLFFSNLHGNWYFLLRCDIVNKKNNLFPHDREKEIETEKGLEGREREILHITPKQKVQGSNLQGTESKKLTFLFIRLHAFFLSKKP